MLGNKKAADMSSGASATVAILMYGSWIMRRHAGPLSDMKRAAVFGRHRW